jgi:hypothetical protein
MLVKNGWLTRWLVLVLLVGGVATKDLLAQASATGNVYAAYYASEDTAQGNLNDLYFGANLNAAPIATQRNFRLKADFRVAKQNSPADWGEKVFSLYADYRTTDRRFDARVGRQFLYRGVLNGTSDGLWLRARPTPEAEVAVFGGLAARYDRSLDLLSWDEGGTIGGLAGYRFGPQARAEVTYINRRSSGETAWHQVGASVAGRILPALLYNAQFDYNIEKSDMQAGRLRLMYLIERWTVSAEFNSQKPRIFEDSYFNIFEIEAFNQVRGGVSYRLSRRYAVGAAYLHTIYAEEESADEVTLTFTTPWGVIGGLLQGGYGGERVGVFGELRFDVLPNLELMARASHQNYERRTISIEQNATGMAAGLRFRPVRKWLLEAEVQNSINTYYDSNVRFLLRAFYAFDFVSR